MATPKEPTVKDLKRANARSDTAFHFAKRIVTGSPINLPLRYHGDFPCAYVASLAPYDGKARAKLFNKPLALLAHDRELFAALFETFDLHWKNFHHEEKT
jgi:hypothetical protein